jgi:hypothetical protein
MLDRVADRHLSGHRRPAPRCRPAGLGSTARPAPAAVDASISSATSQAALWRSASACSLASSPRRLLHHTPQLDPLRAGDRVVDRRATHADPGSQGTHETRAWRVRDRPPVAHAVSFDAEAGGGG